MKIFIGLLTFTAVVLAHKQDGGQQNGGGNVWQTGGGGNSNGWRSMRGPPKGWQASGKNNGWLAQEGNRLPPAQGGNTLDWGQAEAAGTDGLHVDNNSDDCPPLNENTSSWQDGTIIDDFYLDEDNKDKDEKVVAWQQQPQHPVQQQEPQPQLQQDPHYQLQEEPQHNLQQEPQHNHQGSLSEDQIHNGHENAGEQGKTREHIVVILVGSSGSDQQPGNSDQPLHVPAAENTGNTWRAAGGGAPEAAWIPGGSQGYNSETYRQNPSNGALPAVGQGNNEGKGDYHFPGAWGVKPANNAGWASPAQNIITTPPHAQSFNPQGGWKLVNDGSNDGKLSNGGWFKGGNPNGSWQYGGPGQRDGGLHRQRPIKGALQWSQPAPGRY